MKTLTVCPGWAELLFLSENPKDVENRSWPTSHRGPLLIHAGKSKKAIALARAYCLSEHLRFLNPSVFGAIVGIVEVVGCDRISKSRWAMSSHYHWQIANPRLFAEPIACKGSLSLWEPSIEIMERVEEFIDFLCSKNKCKPSTIVNRIEFKYL